MNIATIELLNESQCLELDALVVQRIDEFNTSATGYSDGCRSGGCIRDAGKLIAGGSGHTWGGFCVITYLWIDEQYRRKGIGQIRFDINEEFHLPIKARATAWVSAAS
jgi:GNAT superfamily N-acetyltransferase